MLTYTEEFWLTDDDQVRQVIKIEPLGRIAVRYRGSSEGRFTAAAQYVPDLVEMLRASGRYVRDMVVSEGRLARILTAHFDQGNPQEFREGQRPCGQPFFEPLGGQRNKGRG